MAQQADRTVAECSLTSCVWACLWIGSHTMLTAYKSHINTDYSIPLCFIATQITGHKIDINSNGNVTWVWHQHRLWYVFEIDIKHRLQYFIGFDIVRRESVYVIAIQFTVYLWDWYWLILQYILSLVSTQIKGRLWVWHQHRWRYFLKFNIDKERSISCTLISTQSLWVWY